MAVRKLKTIGDLREELLDLYMDVKNKTIDLKDAAEMNNTAGKIINTFKVELEAYSLMKEAPKKSEIRFLKG